MRVIHLILNFYTVLTHLTYIKAMSIMTLQVLWYLPLIFILFSFCVGLVDNFPKKTTQLYSSGNK